MISLICYILAGIIFLSGLVVFVRGVRKRKKLPKYEFDERGIIKWKGKEGEKDPDRFLELYLLSQILAQISELPTRSEIYFIIAFITTLLVALLLTIIGMIAALFAMIAG